MRPKFLDRPDVFNSKRTSQSWAEYANPVEHHQPYRFSDFLIALIGVAVIAAVVIGSTWLPGGGA